MLTQFDTVKLEKVNLVLKYLTSGLLQIRILGIIGRRAASKCNSTKLIT